MKAFLRCRRDVEMSKSNFRMIGLVVLLGALFASGGTKEASAGASTNINIGPPPIVVAGPPEVVIIPGLQIYTDSVLKVEEKSEVIEIRFLFLQIVNL